MPAGYSNITPGDGQQFSKGYQPKNRRTSTKPLTDLLLKELSKKDEIIVSGFDVITGKLHKVRVAMPSKRAIVAKLCRLAQGGNVPAIALIMDRTDGKVAQPVDMGPGDMTITINGKPPEDGQY